MLVQTDEERRLNIKLKLMNPVQTQKKRSIGSIVANFKCGLPNIIKEQNNDQDDGAQFSLYKSRQKEKSQVLVIEDPENEIVYYDKQIISKKLRHQQQKFSLFMIIMVQQKQYVQQNKQEINWNL